MGFIVGRAYPIIKSMADAGNQDAKNLLSGLEKMDQSKVDEMVSSLLGGGGNNKPSSFTDVVSGKDKAELEKTVVPFMPRGGLSKEQQKDLKVDGYEVDEKAKAEFEKNLVEPDNTNKSGITEKSGTLENFDYKVSLDKEKNLVDGAIKVGKSWMVFNRKEDGTFTTGYGTRKNDKKILEKRLKILKEEFGIFGDEEDESTKEIMDGIAEFGPRYTPDGDDKKPKDPLGEENLQKLFDDGFDVDEVIDKVRVQMKDVQLNPDDPMGDGDLQSVVEAFEMGYKPKGGYKSFTELVSQDDEVLSPKTDEEKKEFDNAYENAVANRGEKGAKRLFNKTKKMLKSFGVKKFADQIDMFVGMILDEKGMRGK